MIKKLSILILSMIMIISCSKNNPNDPNNGGTTPDLPQTSVNFDEVFLKFVTDDKTVPTFTFFKDDGKAEEYDPITGPTGNIIDYKRSWTADNDGNNVCYIYNAPDGESKNGIPNDPNNQKVALLQLKIYSYRGVNPFKTAADNNIEKQFYFYRYTGYPLLVMDMLFLDTYLIAVDTKTGLIFPYAVPEYWKENAFYKNVYEPNGWISSELGKTGKPGTTDQQNNFEAHKFWQYDPIGKVNDDGTVTLEQFYIDGQASGDYAPKYTGKSPYKNIQ